MGAGCVEVAPHFVHSSSYIKCQERDECNYNLFIKSHLKLPLPPPQKCPSIQVKTVTEYIF